MIGPLIFSARLGLGTLVSVFLSGCAHVDAAIVSSTNAVEPAEVKQTIPTSPVGLSQDRYALGETADEYDNAPWKKIATQADQARLYAWIKALSAGIRGAVQSGQRDKVDDPIGLFGINSPAENSSLPAGLYSCSITKLSSRSDRGLPYVAYPAFRCRVIEEDGRLHFTKLTGSQRTAGWIYSASKRHSVYLGTSFYGYEDKATPYGETEERDQAAVVQRIGASRWRMIFPYPYYESVVDVMELTPITE